MTTTPLPALPALPALPKPNLHLGVIVSSKGKYQSTEDGFTADQMQAYATQARADLEAENHRLREALKAILDEQDANGGYAKPATYDAARAALESKQ